VFDAHAAAPSGGSDAKQAMSGVAEPLLSAAVALQDQPRASAYQIQEGSLQAG
jgi:hypothetical protein